jgi:glycosyltransferase involved in cell wall biosynthesis
MKIFFHSAHWGYRGTEVALYDYAHHAEKIFGAESVILVSQDKAASKGPLGDRFRRRFQVTEYRSWGEAEEILQSEKADLLYTIKNGFFDGAVSSGTKTAVHAIFPESDFHGDRYAYVSPWLSRVMSLGRTPWVPHIVDLSPVARNLRTELAIPKDAVVLGRHGGGDSFDLSFARAEILRAVQRRKDLWFLFLGTDPFPLPKGLRRIRFLPATVDPEEKSAFLQACDGMIHARYRGETFGLAVAEFACMGKPVITWSRSPESFHLEALGDGHPRYRDADDLSRILGRFEKPSSQPSSLYQEICMPKFAMERFRRHLLD